MYSFSYCKYHYRCYGKTPNTHLAGHDHVNLEAIIEWVWRYSWSSEFGHALGGRDQGSLGMHLEAVIKRVWRCTWRPWSTEIGAVLGGDQSGGGSSGGRHNGSWHTIHWLTRTGGNVENRVNMVCREMGDWLGVGDRRCWYDAICGVCSTRCMLYSVLTLDHSMERWRGMT